MPDACNRRDFVRTAAGVGAALSVAGQALGRTAAQGRVIGANDRINVGAIGVGGRGTHVATTFAELGIDSLDGVNIMFALEEEFKIDIPDAVAQNMRSVRQVVDGLTRVMEGKDISDLVAMAKSQTPSTGK